MRVKKEHDFAVTAFNVVQQATEGKGIDYKAIGRKGGLKGGRARAERLSPERRSEIAKKAAMARWNKA
ncbi:histone H1 [Chloroflexota bacterium]